MISKCTISNSDNRKTVYKITFILLSKSFVCVLKTNTKFCIAYLFQENKETK